MVTSLPKENCENVARDVIKIIMSEHYIMILAHVHFYLIAVTKENFVISYFQMLSKNWKF